MKIREILSESALILGEDELANDIAQKTEDLNAEHKRKTNVLLSSFNNIQNEIALNYQMPEKTVEINGNKIDTSKLSPLPIKIFAVYDCNGRRLDYEYVDGIINVNGNAQKLKYGFVPSDNDIDDEFDYVEKPISKRTFTYGVAAEYCLKEGRYEESVNWESRYRLSLEVKKDFSKKRIKAGRRWGL